MVFGRHWNWFYPVTLQAIIGKSSSCRPEKPETKTDERKGIMLGGVSVPCLGALLNNQLGWQHQDDLA
jgi:hypothetical protein